MERFALSERWNGWTDLDAMVTAARAAIAGGPLDPLVCEITVEDDEDTMVLDGIEALEALLAGDEEPLSIELYLAHVLEDDASVTIVFNGRWLQLNGAGADWERSRKAYYAAQVELALVYGITTFKLPEPPPDTVSVVRKRIGAKDLDPGREEADAGRRPKE